MDVLVVVGDRPVPDHLAGRAGHVVHTDSLSPGDIAHTRTHIPRSVGVIGPKEAASSLHDAGLPVTWYSDEAGEAPEGVRVLPLTDDGPPLEAASSLIDLFGNTPMVRMDRIGRDLDCHLLGKLEMLNPGSSVKDRPALFMIEAAERDGRLKPGGTIVEPTSGNTGVGLAIVAARKRYRCVFVCPDKVSPEKISLLRAYGAEVLVCPTAVPPEHPESYYSVSNRLAEEIPGAFKPDQYSNPANPQSHVETTGPEIWRQTGGRITHLVASLGTAGTICGLGRFLKSQNPDIQIIGADPEGSVYSGGSGRPYLVEGIGEDFWPANWDPTVVDRIVMVSDRDSFMTARHVTREEGVLIGGSGGTAVWAALEVSRGLGPEAVVVVILPDSGRGYLSKLYDDRWMADYGFLRSGGRTVGEVLAAKQGRLPHLVHVHPEESVRTAISILREYEVSQVPVVAHEPPVQMGEVVGSLHEAAVMRLAFDDPAALDKPVSEVMGAPLPIIGSGEPVEDAVDLLEKGPAALVVDNGNPIGVLTRSDIVEYLAGETR